MSNGKISREVIFPSHRADKFGEKFQNAVGQAHKLGIPPLVLVEFAEYWTRHKNAAGAYVINKYIRAIVEAQPLVVEGYTFCGTLDHRLDPYQPLVKEAFAGAVPALYWDRGPVCEHCHSNRQRATTYVFEKSGEYKQVGSTCLRDFFGYDPTASLEYYGTSLVSEDWNNEIQGYELWPTLDYLSLLLALISRHGYTSTAQAKDDPVLVSSALQASDFYYPLQPGASEKLKQYRREVCREAAKRVDDAQALLDFGWAFASQGHESYHHNLVQLLGAGGFPPRYAPFVASIYAVKVKADRKAREQAARSNEYVSEVGKRTVFELTVRKVINWATDYGTTHCHILNDAAGNTLVWKASSECLDEGKRYLLRGTVKSHEDRDGVHQTLLSRCKVEHTFDD